MEQQQKERKLTAQQEAFCLGIVSGLSQYEAYLQAYPGSKNLKSTCLAIFPHVQGRDSMGR